jgi:hypothetical protein
VKYEGTAAVAPPEDRLAGRLKEAMLWILAFFVFSLPLVEAPKNLAAVLFVLSWVAYAVRTRDFGGRWNRYDTVFLATLASGLASGLAGYAGDVSGMFRVFLLGWVISRAPLSNKAGRVLPAAACIGVLIAIAMAAVPFLRGTKGFLELPSVGHVNQSALYIAILTACAFGWWLQGAQSGQGGRMRTGMGISATVCCLALLAGGSRAAAGAVALAAVLMAAAILGTGHSPVRRKLLGRAAVTVAILAVLVAALGAWAPGLSDRKLTAQGLLRTDSTETRIKHWHLAVEGWREKPWLGWGPEAFQRIKIDDVCRWRAARGEGCDRSLYLQQVHAHSVYAGTLAERGIVGALTLAALLAAWAWSLLASVRTASSSWLWTASAAGFVIVAVAGTFNTTLRVEHGSLALVWFGLWIAAYARRSSPPAVA